MYLVFAVYLGNSRARLCPVEPAPVGSTLTYTHTLTLTRLSGSIYSPVESPNVGCSMRHVTFVFSLMTAMILAGCDTGEYFQGDESAGNDSGWHDAVSLPDVATQPDLGNTTNELRLYKSGSRIKAKVLKTADGAQAFAGFYDTELETDCWFTTASDGKTRCSPSYQVNVSTSNYFYSGSTCSRRIFWTGAYKACPPSLEWVVQMELAGETCATYYKYTYYRNVEVYQEIKSFRKF